MYLRDKVSLHEITKRTGLSRNTVRRWLRTPEEVQVPAYNRAAGFSKLSGFMTELEQWFRAVRCGPSTIVARDARCSCKFKPAVMPVATPVSPTSSVPGAPAPAKSRRPSSH